MNGQPSANTDNAANPVPAVNTIGPAEQILTVSHVHRNVEQEVIVVTVDRAELCLRNHLSRMNAANGWQTPVGICLSLILTLTSATFHDSFGLPAATLQAMFILATIATAFWAAISGFRAWRMHTTLEEVLAELKKPAVAVAKV